MRRVSLETLIKNPLTSMTLVFRFCYMSSVRSTSDSRGPVTRKRVPDREEPGKPRKDARRGRCHLLEAGFWPLWMTPLPRNYAAQAQAQVSAITCRCSAESHTGLCPCTQRPVRHSDPGRVDACIVPPPPWMPECRPLASSSLVLIPARGAAANGTGRA